MTLRRSPSWVLGSCAALLLWSPAARGDAPSPLEEMRQAAAAAADVEPERSGRQTTGAAPRRRDLVRDVVAAELTREAADRGVGGVSGQGKAAAAPGQARRDGGPPPGLADLERARGAAQRAQEAQRGREVAKGRGQGQGRGKGGESP